MAKPFEVVMPQLGLTMTEGRIVRWIKTDGQPVQKGEPLLEVESDKFVVEVESPASGVLRILLGENAAVPIGQRIALIGEPGGEPAASGAVVTPGTPPESVSAPRVPTPPAPVRPAGAGAVPASPAAKRLAREHGVDLSLIPGSGPGGRILEHDVHRHLEARAQTGPAFIEVGRVKKAAAQRLTESFSGVPHFYLAVEADAGQLVVLKERLAPAVEADTGCRLTFTDLLIKALGLTIPRHPLVNASWEGDRIRLHDEVNIGIATATDHGLFVPVVRQADRKDLAEVVRARHALVQKAREGRLKPDDVSGGTFTLTNLGTVGIDVAIAVINPPQSAILAVGNIRERPVASAGTIVARPTIHMSLSADHRVLDGFEAAQFLAALRVLIEHSGDGLSKR